MPELSLEQATTIARATLERARARGSKPLAVAVLDAGGHIKVVQRDDGASILRTDIAVAKAWGAVAMGTSSREVAAMAAERPQFVASLGALTGGRVAPAAGGLPIRDPEGAIVGAAGASGDTSDVDEECVRYGIEAAGLSAG